MRRTKTRAQKVIRTLGMEYSLCRGQRESKKGKERIKEFSYLAINQVKLLLLILTLDREDIGLGETKLEVPSPV